MLDICRLMAESLTGISNSQLSDCRDCRKRQEAGRCGKIGNPIGKRPDNPFTQGGVRE